MRTLLLLLIDVALFAGATILAFALRGNLEFEIFDLILLKSYVLASISAAAIAFHVAGISREIWSHANYRVYLRIMIAVGFAISAALLVAFTNDRLEGVPRSIPILQFLGGSGLLIGSRKAVQIWDRWKRRGAFRGFDAHAVPHAHPTPALIIGINELASVALRLLAAQNRARMEVIGIVSTSREDVGRTAFGLPVLGCVETLGTVLAHLPIHGVEKPDIILALPMDELPLVMQEKLRRLSDEGGLSLWTVPELMFSCFDISASPAKAGTEAVAARYAGDAQVRQVEIFSIASRPYWRVKRAIDFLISGTALVLVSPVILLLAGIVALSMGRPVIFWQRRPGMGGRPFHVYKFRTMRNAVNANGYVLPDDQRVSVVGNFLRRTRLDELPQLINVVRGDMAIVGPRPLLPRDQSHDPGLRMAVRPGLTGWAQVLGGRTVSAGDKSMLDIWYVRNASLWLDLRIIFRTIPMVIFGERVDVKAIEKSIYEVQNLISPAE